MITGVVLARNEAHNIVECLQSLQPYVEEMLLIDMESDDNTMELSRPLVSKVLSHPLVDNFDPARNIATEHAQHDWLWFLDADERVPASVGEVVRDLVRKHGDQYAAINIPFRTYFCGRWIKHCGWWPGYTMPRVLKRGHFRFADKLHGGVEVDGPQLRVSAEPDLAIEHYSYRSVEHYVEKFNRYTSTEARQLASQGQAFECSEATRHMIRELWNYYEHHSGHQDGEQGWILSWLSGQYRWLTHAKLLDAAPSQEHAPSIPGSLDDVLQVMQDELDRVRRLKPQLPLGVVLRSPIWDCSGYADEGRAIARALSNGSRELTIEPINWSSQSCSISEDETALLRALTRTTRPRHAITITNCIPTLCEPDPKAVLNVLRTTFETDRIPPEWLPRIEAFDEVWVISQHNRRAFVRSGLPPERVHVVPSLMDVRPYRIPGTPFTLPAPLQDRFVFLSVFDWQLRKGWDVLLDAYCREFSVADGVGLLLKISRLHGCSAEGVQAQANAVLERTGTTLPQRPDIVILDEMLTAEELRRLYGSVDAFVLASRGEGWGRPYMEAMAAGLPTIGTAASGNIDFMDESNSYLIPAQLVDVPDVAAQEIPPYRGHCWYEPDRESLQTTMRKVFVDAERREQVGARGRQCVEQRYDLAAGLQQLQAAVRATEVNHLDVAPVEAAPDAISVQLEGELFAGHSFSNINERLAMGLGTDGAFDFSIQRQFLHPPIDGHSPHAHRLEPFVGRQLAKDPEVTIRHAFPPNWEKPATGKWVHVQPWEFGHLPRAWLGPLQNDVDEIWCPSEYVRRVYVQSGIPEEKLHVIPWGFDPEFFSPDVPARLLPTQKGFRFLFVGGTIARKGFDVLLDAYLEEFGPDEDVCLVVKDVGSQSFYRVGNDRERIFTAQQDATAPEILYRDDQLTRGQLASLYTACDCLVAPYRGEGFGLPILEAMACGLPPIVPRAGASDDFVSDENGYRIASEEIETQHEWELCGPATELQIDVSELRRAMRHVFEQRQQCKARGLAAAKHVHQHCTWEQSIDAMKERIKAFCYQGEIKSLAACVVVHNHERTLGDCLSRLAPHVDQLLVIDGGSTDRARVIAAEYGATISDCLQAILAELARSDGW